MSKENKVLKDIQRASYAQDLYRNLEAYPSSPPLGLPAPLARQAVVKTAQYLDTNGNVVTSNILECENLSNDRLNVAYLLSGGLIHTTLCGEILLCHVLENCHSGDLKGDNASACTFYETHKQVAIKIDKRKVMRRLHDETTSPIDHNKHQPFPENPWKEVSVLQLLQSKHCDNIITLLDALYDDDCLYEILPYYPKSLYWHIQLENSNGLKEDIARGYFLQLINAIHALHSQGICHRDISSHNIMLDKESERLVLIDFGMSLCIPYCFPDDHFTEDHTDISAGTTRHLIHSQSHCGKLRFMAPEMYCCQDFDGLAVDLWSAAVVLFEMLAGKLPYNKPDASADEGYHDLLDERFYWDPIGVDQLFSWGHPVSKEAVDLLKKMFRPDPRDRISFAEIAAHPWLTEAV